jgi:hypothetical protein
MKRMYLVLIALLACASVIPLIGQAPGPLRPPAAGTTKADGAAAALSVREYDGGTVTTDLGYNIKVNENSSLRRRWFVLNDPRSPLQIGEAGVRAVYRSGSGYASGEYKFEPYGTLRADKELYAFEIRFVLFDMWGGWMQSLSGTEVRDAQAGVTIALSSMGKWRAWENDVSQMYTVVAFVAHARLGDGTVWINDEAQVLAEIQKIKLRVTEKELTPERVRPGGG